MHDDKAQLIKILSDLISFQSETPNDAGCQDYMLSLLEKLGFRLQKFNRCPVCNFYAEFGDKGPLLLFAGHTDVVPAGDLTQWHTDPYVLSVKNTILYGRGVADMKGSLACMLIACQRFITQFPKSSGRIGLLITSGEEGDDFAHGTPYVMQKLQEQSINVDYCIVGEPSSSARLGDVIKIGRRGSLTAKIIIRGEQGHVAYPHLAKNPIHMVAPAISELVSTVWDNGNEYFPPTTMQIVRVSSDGGAGNIIPGVIEIDLNFRYSVLQTAQSLQDAVFACFRKYALQSDITWILNGEPFLTTKGKLLDTCKQVIYEKMGEVVELSTSGGTSDGRFIAPFGIELVELGLINKTIHQVNESVNINDLYDLADLYFLICAKLLT